jgi:hypothetical protein
MEPRVPQNLIRVEDADAFGMNEGAGFCHAPWTKPSVFGRMPPELARRVEARRIGLEENWNDQDCENVYDFDHRIDRGAGCIFVGIAHSVAGYCRCVSG